MASELRVNTLKDAAGNNSIATSFVAGGSAKAWNCFNTDAVLRDSLNTASITDNGTANFDTNLTSSFANDDYAFSGACGAHSGTSIQIIGGNSATVKETGQYGIRNQNSGSAFNDTNDMMTIAHGDLA
tara:strand:+ start:250 stop:633 length:384 start_codon:yes stop_codon:yes gene_type:complete